MFVFWLRILPLSLEVYPRVCVVCLYTADYVSVHIFVSSDFGTRVGMLVDNGTRVFMHISIGRHHTTYYSTINKTSMLFLSISFIVLMIISLAWLVFYYVQRSRYTYAKQRLSVIVFGGCSPKFLRGFCLDGPYECTDQI